MCAVTKALSKRPYRYGADQIRQMSIRYYPPPPLSFVFQTADRASRAAVLPGGFLGQWSSCGERWIRADPGVEESAPAAEQS